MSFLCNKILLVLFCVEIHVDLYVVDSLLTVAIFLVPKNSKFYKTHCLTKACTWFDWMASECVAVRIGRGYMVKS